MWKEWIKVARLWSLTAAIIPVTLGASLSWSQGRANWSGFWITLLAGACIQAGVNVFNSYDDYRNGVDSKKRTYGPSSSPVIRGTLSLTALRWAGLGLFAFSSALGLYLAATCGWPVLLYGILGVIGGYCYTGGNWPYKYHGLGLVLVFWLMGPLMVVPSYFIQSGEQSLLPWLASLPIGFVVMAIMQANDIRDVEDDRYAGIKTLATVLGRRKSIWLYEGMWLAAYATQIWAITQGYLPWTTVATVALWPSLGRGHCSYSKAEIAKSDLLMLVRLTAKWHFLYGALMAAGVMCGGFGK